MAAAIWHPAHPSPLGPFGNPAAAANAFPALSPEVLLRYTALSSTAFSSTWAPLVPSPAALPRRLHTAARRPPPDGCCSDGSVGSSTPGCSTASSGNSPTGPLSPVAVRQKPHPFAPETTSAPMPAPHADVAAAVAAAAAAAPGRSHRHQHNSLYKTELCRSWEETGSCRYGAKCQFAHGREELRPVRHHPKYKTEVCESFARTGTCPYGRRCRFIHLTSTLAALNHEAAATAAAATGRGAAAPPAAHADPEGDALAALLQEVSRLDAGTAPLPRAQEPARRRLPIFESISGCA